MASLALGAVVLVVGAGCQSDAPNRDHAANPALKRIETPANASSADADRAALGRFVGVWRFEGWAQEPEGVRRPVAGHAAGVIENRYFVLLDVQTTSGDLGDGSGRKSGSMLFASDPRNAPGPNLNLMAWGDASPSIRGLIGSVNGDGSVFSFYEGPTGEDRPHCAVTFTFETDDRWIAEIKDATTSGSPVMARYQFTRSTN